MTARIVRFAARKGWHIHEGEFYGHGMRFPFLTWMPVQAHENEVQILCQMTEAAGTAGLRQEFSEYLPRNASIGDRLRMWAERHGWRVTGDSIPDNGWLLSGFGKPAFIPWDEYPASADVALAIDALDMGAPRVRRELLRLVRPRWSWLPA